MIISLLVRTSESSILFRVALLSQVPCLLPKIDKSAAIRAGNQRLIRLRSRNTRRRHLHITPPANARLELYDRRVPPMGKDSVVALQKVRVGRFCKAFAYAFKFHQLPCDMLLPLGNLPQFLIHPRLRGREVLLAVRKIRLEDLRLL